MTEDLLKAALLGTDQYVPQFVSSITDLPKKITASATDKEDNFLKQTAAWFIMRQSGFTLGHSDLHLTPLEAENEVYISENCESALIRALADNDHLFIDYLIQNLHQSQRVIPTSLVPDFIQLALQTPKKSAFYLQVCGKTLLWLAPYTSGLETHLPNKTDKEFDFETAEFEDRLTYLSHLQTDNQTEFFTLFTSAFKAENADKKTELLSLLANRTYPEEIEFLEAQLAQKSKKVSERALAILQQTPGTTQYHALLQLLGELVSVNEERILLVKKKKTLVFTPCKNAETLRSMGIAELSPDKSVSDAQFQFIQAMSKIPWNSLIQQLNLETAEMVTLLIQSNKSDYWSNLLHRAAMDNAQPTLVNEMLLQTETAFLIQSLNEKDLIQILPQLLSQNSLEFKRNILIELGSLLAKTGFYTFSMQTSDAIINILENEPLYYENTAKKMGYFLHPNSLPKLENALTRAVNQQSNTIKQLEHILHSLQLKLLV